MTTINKRVSYARAGEEVLTYYKEVNNNFQNSKNCKSQYMPGLDDIDNYKYDGHENQRNQMNERNNTYLNKISNYATNKQYNRFGFSGNEEIEVPISETPKPQNPKTPKPLTW